MRNVLVGLVACAALVSAAQASVVTLDMQTGKTEGNYVVGTVSLSGTTIVGSAFSSGGSMEGFVGGVSLATKAATDYYFAHNVWGNFAGGGDGLPTDGQIISSGFGTLQFTYGASAGASPSVGVTWYSTYAFNLVPSQQAKYDKMLVATWSPYGGKASSITVTYDDLSTSVFNISDSAPTETLMSNLDRWNGKIATTTANTEGENYQNTAGSKLDLFALTTDPNKVVTSFSFVGGGEVAVYDTFGIQAVPEPTTTAVLALGGLCLLRRRRA